MIGKRAQPQSSLTAVTATGAGTWINTADSTDAIVLVTAASVTTGGTVLIEGNTQTDGSGTTYTVATVPVSANGSTATSLTASQVPAAIRANVSARTDGTYTVVVCERNR